MQHRLVRSLTLRFTVDEGGRLRCRVTDALRERFWMVADAAELYETVRGLIGEPGAGAEPACERD